VPDPMTTPTAVHVRSRRAGDSVKAFRPPPVLDPVGWSTSGWRRVVGRDRQPWPRRSSPAPTELSRFMYSPIYCDRDPSRRGRRTSADASDEPKGRSAPRRVCRTLDLLVKFPTATQVETSAHAHSEARAGGALWVVLDRPGRAVPPLCELTNLPPTARTQRRCTRMALGHDTDSSDGRSPHRG